MLGGPPTLVLIDELPPYLDNARSIAIGNSDLGHVTATAVSNLFVAVGEGGLENVCVVLTDLVGTYEDASGALGATVGTIQSEAERHARNLTPVRINSDEFFEILRKRLFVALPSAADVRQVAAEYAAAIERARQMDISAQSPEQFADSIVRAYPFHPSIKDLYARFRENKGFQQTRALLRLMRIVIAGLWESKSADSRPLIGAEDVNPGDPEILSELRQINPTLENAISHDIAQGGSAVAETMDANLGSRDATDVCRLLLMASLANVPNAVRGLTVAEVVTYLARPGRNLDRIKGEVMTPLGTAAWYLHADGQGLLARDRQVREQGAVRGGEDQRPRERSQPGSRDGAM